MKNKTFKLALTIVIAGVLVFGASFAKAQTTNEDMVKMLQSLIQVLMQKIQQLQQQLAQNTTTPISTPPTTLVPSSSSSKFFIMEDDGSLLSENNNIINVNLDHAAIKRFYNNFNDDYDFLSFYTAFSTNQQPSTRYHTTISNDVKGINFAITDYSQDYGSKGRLKGINFMQSVDEYDLQDPIFPPLLHEMGHQWLAYIGNHADGDKLNITQDGIHWSEKTNTDWDPLGGVRYNYNGDGTFTMLSHSSGEPWQYYCPLSLYLMGLMPSKEVPDLMVVTVQDPACLNDLDYLNGRKTCPGTARYVSIKDVIAVEGERLPSFMNSQKDFRMAFILITKKGQKPTDEQIQKMNYIVENFPNAWAKATRNLSTMSTNLLSAPSLACTDSDGGNNPYVKGTVTYNGQTHTDFCPMIIPSGIPSTKTVYEFYCENGVMKEGPNDCPTGYTCQDGACKSTTNSVTVISPNGAEQLEIGKQTEIRWSAIGFPNTVPVQIGIYNVNYDSEGGSCPEFTIANTTNTGMYLWTPQLWGQCPAGNGYKIKIYVGKESEGFDQSDVPFNLIASSTSTCTDSDGGNNPYAKGTLIYNGQTYTDTCFDSLNVVEYYCYNNQKVQTSFACPSGYTCQDGACKISTPPTTIVPACSESDGGNDYNVKGSCYDTTTGKTFYDYCDEEMGGTLKGGLEEVSCKYVPIGQGSPGIEGKTVCVYSGYICAYGCKNGACLPTLTPTCTDSDNGQNYYIKGTTTGTSSGSDYPRVITETDKCADASTLYEYSCFYTKNVVDATWGYYFGSNTVPCPSGYTCQDGACKSSTALMDALNKLSASLISLIELLKR